MANVEYCQNCGNEIKDIYNARYYDRGERELAFCCENCVEEYCEKNDLVADPEEATLEKKKELQND